MNTRKGIILAGGHGTRLYPITKAISKQLLPIYDKPMIYYPLTTLMLAGIKDILIITTPRDKNSFISLLGDGKDWGININYETQKEPLGITEAFLIAENFLGNSPSTLILGDNLFHGQGFVKMLKDASSEEEGATVFVYPVIDPERYAIAEVDNDGKVISLEEKPINPTSIYAITGIYFYDNTVVQKAKKIKPSKRGELEITDLNKLYLKEEKLKLKFMGRGMTWLDTGTHNSLHEASSYIRTIESRQGLKIGCPEEVSWRLGLISKDQLYKLTTNCSGNDYKIYLKGLIDK